MKKFMVGNIYQMHSPCDWDCVWMYQVISRTEKTITICDIDNGKISTRRVSKKSSEYLGVEVIYPLGQYSLCPVLIAERMAI